jgi:hypothetical protein
VVRHADARIAGVAAMLSPDSRLARGRRRAARPLAVLLGTAVVTLAGLLGLGIGSGLGMGMQLGMNGQAPEHAGTAAAGGRHRRAHAKHAKPRRASALKMMWGPVTMPNGSSAFPIYHRLGVQVLELQLSWARTARAQPTNPTDPADPAYRWPQQLEEAVTQASQYGIQLAVMVRETPEWANGGQSTSWTPNNPVDYANFVQAASRRYPTVHDWMIWGEVTREGIFDPMASGSPVGPERYAALLDAAYGALKSVSASNKVIGGMTFTTGVLGAPEFIKWMRLPDGAPPRMDYFGHNPYSTRYPDLAEQPYAHGVRDINDIDTLHRELEIAYRGHGVTPKLWLSEFGISSGGPNRAFEYYVSTAVQARWVTAAFRLADSVPYVAGLGWYELLDEPVSVQSRITEGLLSAEGTPKPAFAAYASVPPAR